jgi:hypothetical protein
MEKRKQRELEYVQKAASLTTNQTVRLKITSKFRLLHVEQYIRGRTLNYPLLCSVSPHSLTLRQPTGRSLPASSTAKG